MFSKSCEYGLQAMLYITLHSSENRNVGLHEISGSQNIPHHFLSKIMQELVKHKYLGSSKGKSGGFYLLKSPQKINLLDIVVVFDGMHLWDHCGLGLHACSDKNPCPIHQEFKGIKEKMKNVLKNKSLLELSQEIKNNKTVLSINPSKTFKYKV